MVAFRRIGSEGLEPTGAIRWGAGKNSVRRQRSIGSSSPNEAGHAVLARVLRLGLRRVTIVWDPVLESPGYCFHGRGGNVDPDPTMRDDRASIQRYIRKRGLFLYGGL